MNAGTVQPSTPDPAQTGGFGIRFAGRLIDWVVTVVLGFFAGAIGGITGAILAAMHVVHGDWLSRIQHAGPFSGLGWGLLAALIYHAVAEGVAGTTPGKLILGFRVVHMDLRPCTFLGAVKRSLAYFVDAFFFGVPAYTAMQKTPFNQRLGDQWADTVVVKAASLPATARRTSGLVALGLFGAFAGHVLVMTISFLLKIL